MESDENFMSCFDDEIIFFRNTVTKTKEKEEKETRIPYFPNNIITGILLRLPVQHVYKLRRVCKQWHQIIFDSHFTDAHLKQAEGCIITRYSTMKSYAQCISLRDDGKIRMRRLDLGFHGYIWSSCNGLLLIQRKKNPQQLCVSNPVTKQFEALPPCSSSISYERFCTIGFISSTKEYKVVNMVNIERSKFGCEILTLGSNTWRKVNEISNWKLGQANALLLDHRVMVDGVLHWIIEKDSIVSFDMKDETFRKTTTPEPRPRTALFMHLIEIGGSLSLMNYDECSPMVSTIEVWILKDFYKENWIKLRTIHFGKMQDQLYHTFPACFGNGEVFILYDNPCGRTGRMYTYDTKQGKLSPMKINLKHLPDFDSSFESYTAHVNSLISWKSPSQ